jgi:hypothetical protein
MQSEENLVYYNAGTLRPKWKPEEAQFVWNERERPNPTPYKVIAAQLGKTVAQCQSKYRKMKESPAPTVFGRWSHEQKLQFVVDLSYVGGNERLVPCRGRTLDALKQMKKKIQENGEGDRLWEEFCGSPH